MRRRIFSLPAAGQWGYHAAALLFCHVFLLLSCPGSRAESFMFPMGNLPLQDLINQAKSGDTIWVKPGRYEFSYQSLTIIKESLVLKSVAGPQRTVLVGRGEFPLIRVEQGSHVIIDGFTLTTVGGARGHDLKGGAVYCAPESAPVLRNNIIVDNRAAFGGGIYCDTLSAPIIEQNVFQGNQAAVNGGGLFSFRTYAIIRANRFVDNRAGTSGGGLAGERDSSRVQNNVFWKNRAAFGGGLSSDRASSTIFNNTLVLNKARYGGGIMVAKGSVRLTNLILWHNSGGDLYMKLTGPAARPLNSLLSDGSFRGINGTLSADPLFVDPDKGDFHLRPESPCIHAGHRDPFFFNTDGSFNTMGAYGGPYLF